MSTQEEAHDNNDKQNGSASKLHTNHGWRILQDNFYDCYFLPPEASTRLGQTYFSIKHRMSAPGPDTPPDSEVAEYLQRELFLSSGVWVFLSPEGPLR